ncbi:MAG: M17 family peptidase N-terminal domain-containing protein, partial [Terriglobales bacterium]
MNTNISSTAPSRVETDCLVVVVLDQSEKGQNANQSKKGQGEKDKPAPAVGTTDAAIRDAAKDVVASGEVTGKMFETTLLHRPAGLKAKRLLLLGGGKAKTFSASDLRKLAGAAVRTLKGKSLRSFAFVLPETSIATGDGVRALVEGALIGDFEPDYYKSDRKDEKIEALTIVTQADANALQSAIDAGRIVAESQNFTRDLVNEPSNRMTP